MVWFHRTVRGGKLSYKVFYKEKVFSDKEKTGHKLIFIMQKYNSIRQIKEVTP